MDQKLTLKYRYASNHVVPVIHGALATAAAGPNKITIHLYNEYPDLPPEASFDIEEELPEETRVADTLVREIQATLVLPLDIASVIGQAFNAVIPEAVEHTEQAEGAEDDS